VGREITWEPVLADERQLFFRALKRAHDRAASEDPHLKVRATVLTPATPTKTHILNIFKTILPMMGRLRKRLLAILRAVEE
jgi:hypothetical protein